MSYYDTQSSIALYEFRDQKITLWETVLLWSIRPWGKFNWCQKNPLLLYACWRPVVIWVWCSTSMWIEIDPLCLRNTQPFRVRMWIESMILSITFISKMQMPAEVYGVLELEHLLSQSHQLLTSTRIRLNPKSISLGFQVISLMKEHMNLPS